MAIKLFGIDGCVLGLDHRFLLARFFTLIETITLRVALYRTSGLVLWHFPDLRRG